MVSLSNYGGHNDPICRLKMRIMVMHMDVVHRNVRFLGGTDYGSQEGGNLWLDFLISQHNTFAVILHKNHTTPYWASSALEHARLLSLQKYKTSGDRINTAVH